VPIASIRPNQYQPRKSFDEESLAELSDSIKALGLLQPILVRETEPGVFELIAGERRWRASKRAGLQTIPVLVQTADDKLSLEKALVENLHRSNLNPIEEASAYKQLIEEFGLTHEEVALRVGKSRAAVSNSLRLFQLPPTVQVMLQEGSITMGHAKVLLATPDRQIQERLAQDAAESKLSVRSLEDAVKKITDGDQRSNIAAPNKADSLYSTESGTDSYRDLNPEYADLQSRHLGSISSKQLRPPGFLELEELLSGHLDTRVKVEMGSKHGKIVIDFATLEDLERIYRAMVGNG
jgi:ParB family chromosome partitioning protein